MLHKPDTPWAWKAHLLNYANLYERARNTPNPTKKGLNSKQQAKARIVLDKLRANRGRS